MTNATLESDRGFDDDGRPVLPVNDLLQSAIYTLTGIVLFAVLLFNHTHIETRDQVKLFGGLELFVRLVASGAAGILGLYGFVFVPKVRLAFISFPGAWVLGSMAFIVLGTICSPEPRTSLPYLLTLISVVLFSPMAFYVVGTKRFINIVLISMTITLLGSWFLYLFMPEYGVVQEHISKTETVAFAGGIFAGACGLMMFVHQLLISIGGRYRLAALISLIIILNSLTEVPIFDYIPGTPTVVWLAAVFWPVLDDGSL